MKIRVDPPSDKFSAEKNSARIFLDKADLAENLNQLFANLSQGSVSILDGKWGTGKTVFAKRWVNRLTELGFGTVYFDAFANDYMGEPFDALSAALLREVEGESSSKSKPYKNLLNRAASVSRRLAITGAKAGVRVATLNALEASDIQGLIDAAAGVSGDAADLGEEAAKSLLKRRAEDLTAFNSFKNSLGEIHRALVSDSNKYLLGYGKTVFVVDELDRCRPDFALSILETLKHFFYADGLHFVLVTNYEFLSAAVEKRYGLGRHSNEYLQKFFDFLIHFEQHARHDSEHASSMHAARVVENLLDGISSNERKNCIEYLVKIVQAYDLSLRQVEKIAVNLCLAYLSLDDRFYKPAILIVFLAFIKLHDPVMYIKLKRNKCSFESVDDLLDKGDWGTFNVERVRNIFFYHMAGDISPRQDELRGYGNALFEYDLNRLDVIPFLCNSVMDNFSAG